MRKTSEDARMAAQIMSRLLAEGFDDGEAMDLGVEVGRIMAEGNDPLGLADRAKYCIEVALPAFFERMRNELFVEAERRAKGVAKGATCEVETFGKTAHSMKKCKRSATYVCPDCGHRVCKPDKEKAFDSCPICSKNIDAYDWRLIGGSEPKKKRREVNQFFSMRNVLKRMPS